MVKDLIEEIKKDPQKGSKEEEEEASIGK